MEAGLRGPVTAAAGYYVQPSIILPPLTGSPLLLLLLLQNIVDVVHFA